jgi:hypothetical protein
MTIPLNAALGEAVSVEVLWTKLLKTLLFLAMRTKNVQRSLKSRRVSTTLALLHTNFPLFVQIDTQLSDRI